MSIKNTGLSKSTTSTTSFSINEADFPPLSQAKKTQQTNIVAHRNLQSQVQESSNRNNNLPPCLDQFAKLRDLAESGNKEAQWSLGLMYLVGKGVNKDIAGAEMWIRKAAEQGNLEAQCTLGMIYAKGVDVSKNTKEAAKWFAQAAEQENVSIESKDFQKAAQNALAAMYLNGIGVTQDDVEAAMWVTKAAEQGDKEAQYTLSFLYSEGRGVAESEVEAKKWCYEAMNNGHLKAKKLWKEYNSKMSSQNLLSEGISLLITHLESRIKNQKDQ